MARKLTELIEQTENDVASELVVMGPDAAAAYSLEAMQPAAEGAANVEESLRCFFFALWFIENAAQHGVASSKAIRDATEISESMLIRAGIKPVSSKFSGLYGRLYLGLSRWSMNTGDAWMSMWHANVSQTLTRAGNREISVSEILIAADRAYALGHTQSAASAYYYAEENAVDSATKARACLGRLLCLRLLGETQQALDLVGAALHNYGSEAEVALEFSWQERLCAYQISGDIEALTVAWERHSPFFRAKFGLVAALVAHGSATFPKRKIRRSSTLKKLDFPEVISHGSYEFDLYKMLVAIEECEDERETIASRLNGLGKFIAETRGQLLAEDQLIFFAATCRWLDRSKQTQFLAFVLNEYIGLSLRVASGRARDTLGLIPDLLESTDIVDPNRHQANLPELPVTSSKRMLKLSALVTQAGLITARSRVRSFFSAPAARPDLSTKMMIDISRFIIEELGTLKGPLMKLGQILVGMDVMPVEARRNIQKALGTTRVMDPAKFHLVFKNEHGRMPAHAFRNWHDEVIGVGSMAQVFKAELHDGTPVAVKIMYPNMSQAVAADITIMKLIKPLVRSLFPSFDADSGLEMYLRIFGEECDFREEAAKHQLWYELFGNRPGVIVPRLYPEYTSRSVLVTDYIQGTKVYEFAQQASIEERKKFCNTIWSVLTEAVTHRLPQFDPHAGNFLYANGKVAFLDFGTVTRLSEEAVKIFVTIIGPIERGDASGFYHAMLATGMLKPDIVDEPFFCEFIAPLIMQRRNPRFDPAKHSMSRFFNLYFEGDLRYALKVSPEITQIFLADFLYHSLLNSILAGEVVGQAPVMETPAAGQPAA